MEDTGAQMEQRNDEINKFDEIHGYSYKIRTNLVQISPNLLYSRPVIHMKFARNSYQFCTNLVRTSCEIHVNFVQFCNTGDKHTSKNTLQSTPIGGVRRGGLGTVPTCRQQDRSGTAKRRAATMFAGTWSEEEAKKGFESFGKAKQWKLQLIQTEFLPISWEFCSLVKL